MTVTRPLKPATFSTLDSACCLNRHIQ